MAPIKPCLLVTLWLFTASSYGQDWPGGTYGLPKAKLGCPQSLKFQWKVGWRFEDTEDTKAANSKSARFHMDAVVHKSDVNRTFCIKESTSPDSKTDWPKGKYCIYKKGACPKGLEEGYIFWDDENNKNINKMGGTLPDGVYDRDTNISYCCRTDGDKMTAMTLPVRSPFYLMAYNSSECQRVKGAVATNEWIRYDNEDTGNQDKWNGTYPYGGGLRNHNVTYCYYESCYYTFSLDGSSQIEFTSPNFFGEGYPLYQTCSWRLLVPKSKTLLVKFPEFKLQKQDVLTIYHGWDESSGMAVELQGHDPSDKGYVSQTNVFFLVFTSKSSHKSQGFRGIFQIAGDAVVSGPVWPSGTYGLPEPRIGCPQSIGFKWKEGWRYEDTEDERPNNKWSPSYHLGTLVMKNDVNRTFCLKTDDVSGKEKSKVEWPKGQYCIYKKGACPKGLEEGYIFWDDENNKNINKMEGTLPDGVYNKDTNISYCCRTDGDKMTAITLPVRSPFYLMAYNSSECQHVKGAVATNEWIRYDNEETENQDKWNGTYPYGGGLVDHNVTYCYYEACHFTISENSQAFTSPNYLDSGYPHSQFCSWRFMVKDKGRQIVLKFPEFNLQKGNDRDMVRIYKGWNDSVPLWAEFNGRHPPPKSGVAFSTSTVYLVFTSDSTGLSRGFSGLFLNTVYHESAVSKDPITIPPKERPKTTTAPTTEGKKNLTNSTASTQRNSVPTPGERKQVAGSSSVPLDIVIPVLIAVVIVVVFISIYCVRRKRIERAKKLRSLLVTATNSSYRDLETQEYDSSEELQDIFPTS